VNGLPYEESFGGITSRIIQHELDHLEGIVFTQRADRYHLEKGRKDRKLSQRRTKRLAKKI
jgi:peptide deformylase